MRTILVLGVGLALAGCGGNPSVPPQVSWSYGAGNGDGVAYNGPAPRYSYGNGLGQDMPVASGQMPTVSRAYGADEVHGAMEQMTPTTNTQVAAPAPANLPSQVAPGTHS